MSEDPKLFDAGDYNLFRYCHNDPEDLTDPMGLGVILVDPYLRTQEAFNENKRSQTPFGRAYELGRDQASHNRDGTINQTARDAFRAVEQSHKLDVTITKTKQLNYDSHQQYKGELLFNKKTHEFLGGKVGFVWNPIAARENTNLTRNSPSAILIHELWHMAGILSNPEAARHGAFTPGSFGSANDEEKRVLGLERSVFPHLRSEGARNDLNALRFFEVDNPAAGGRE